METEPQTKTPVPYGRVFNCYLTFALNGALALAIGAMMPYIRDGYGLNYALTGLLLSLHSVGNLIASFAAGILPLKLGRRKSILLLVSCYPISFALILLSGQPWVLMVAFLMTGLIRGSVSNFNNTEINLLLPGRGWALNALHASFAVGAVLSPLLVVLCTQTFGSWRLMCALLIAFGLVDFVIYGTMPLAMDKMEKSEKGGNLGFLQHRQYWLSTGLLFLYLCAEQGVIGWMVTYFQDTGIMSAGYAQTMASVLWVLILVGRLVTAWLCSRFNERMLLVIMGSGMALFFLIILNSTSLPVITLGIAGFGFSMAGFYPTAVTLSADLMQKYPLTWSFILTPASFGSILMPGIVGAVAETAGITSGIRTITVAVVACLLMAILNLLWGEKGTKQHQK